MISGRIKSVEIKAENIEPGEMLALSCIYDGVLAIAEVTHLDKDGVYNIKSEIYSGPLKDNHRLTKIVVETNNGRLITLKPSLWKQVINAKMVDIEDSFSFYLIPFKFKKGNFMNECSECHCHFAAAKNQPYCSDCCEIHSFAAFKFSEKRTNKTRRPRLFSETVLRDAVEAAFQAGKSGKINFDEWYINYSKDALHSTNKKAPQNGRLDQTQSDYSVD